MNPRKRQVLESFRAGVQDPVSPESFLGQFVPDADLTGVCYDVREIYTDYFLVSFWWEIKR